MILRLIRIIPLPSLLIFLNNPPPTSPLQLMLHLMLPLLSLKPVPLKLPLIIPPRLLRPLYIYYPAPMASHIMRPPNHLPYDTPFSRKAPARVFSNGILTSLIPLMILPNLFHNLRLSLPLFTPTHHQRPPHIPPNFPTTSRQLLVVPSHSPSPLKPTGCHPFQTISLSMRPTLLMPTIGSLYRPCMLLSTLIHL